MEQDGPALLWSADASGSFGGLSLVGALCLTDDGSCEQVNKDGAQLQ
jgi:hypothetical protein